MSFKEKQHNFWAKTPRVVRTFFKLSGLFGVPIAIGAMFLL